MAATFGSLNHGGLKGSRPWLAAFLPRGCFSPSSKAIMPKPIRLDTVASRSDLAAQLDVPIAAINLVSLVEASCKSQSCPLPAVPGNQGRCLLCAQSWFPRQGNLNQRGYGLFGPQFLRINGGQPWQGC